MALARRDIDHIFEHLRGGTVPERGLDAFAVGIERPREEIARLLDMAADNEGLFKFLRGGYGCGKTFVARLTMADALARGFATSFVVVSDNDLQLHRFDQLYRKIVQGLATSSCPRGALGDIIDRWIGRVEDGLIDAGADEDALGFDDKVQERLGEELASMTGGRAPEDMTRVLRAVFSCKQQRQLAEAGALLSWLAASRNVAAAAKKVAAIKGDITGADAMHYLRGILEIVKAAGYRGLVIVIDEAETILRMRRDVRGRCLNGLRQLYDDAHTMPGLLWLVTGTPDFFDNRRGVAGLEPLHERIRFMVHDGGRASLRQPQLKLEDFKHERLHEVTLKLRELFPTSDRTRLEQLVSTDYLERLIDRVSEGFGGEVEVVPRQLLRELVDVMDLVEQDPDFDPMSDLGFTPKQPTEDELRLVEGKSAYDPEPEDDLGYQPALVAF